MSVCSRVRVLQRECVLVTRRNSYSLLFLDSPHTPHFTLPHPYPLSLTLSHPLTGGNLGRRDDRDGNDDISIASQDGAARCVVCVVLFCVVPNVSCNVIHVMLLTLSPSCLSSHSPLSP